VAAQELNTSARQLVERFFHIVRKERDRLLCANAILMTFGSKEHDVRVGAGNAQLDLPLLVVEWLIGGDRKPQCLCVELERLVLITYRDPGELDSFDH
jgi:hypothetical protein